MGLWVIFFSASAHFFVDAAEDLIAKQRNVSTPRVNLMFVTQWHVSALIF